MTDKHFHVKMFHMEDSPLLSTITALVRLSRRVHAVLDGPLEKQLGLSFNEISLLRLIDEGAENPGDLARGLSLPAPTVSRMLNHLSELGLVERSLDTENLRRVRLSLTPAGRKTRAEIRRVAYGLIKENFGGIPTPVLQQALEALLALEPHLWEAQYA